ncbi:hypothetical protein C8F04DRAFT_1237010 [Mycena alexandri]|uniref:Uncharacterized protein n=1 Tax=Mycena alexandri TaxID=1745969 RepID=A0AAD6SME7_9AGAR|nr:hypothetical protein C8F04DRAFT_1237010 [Mycena alexandri]
MSESSHGSRASGRARFRRTFRSRGIAVVNRGNWSRISVVSIVSVRAQRELVRINGYAKWFVGSRATSWKGSTRGGAESGFRAFDWLRAGKGVTSGIGGGNFVPG